MRREPYHQGSLDCLCGLYALVNAAEWALRESEPFHPGEARAFMRHLICELEEQGKLSAVMSAGLTIPALGRVMDAAGDWLADNKGWDLFRAKPFHAKPHASPAVLKSVLADHLSDEATSAILLIERGTKHWTVATGVSDKYIRLADSEGRRRLPCPPHRIPETSREDRQPSRIIPQGLYLLSCQAI